jgi:acetoin:2,6-dichlorophenolindophenol oxidoreductase subunit alpha
MTISNTIGGIDWLAASYRSMLRIRRFEERVADMVDDGEIRTPCHLYIGQEAIATGVLMGLEATDLVWGGHRSHGHYLAKGGDMRRMMAEILGKATGCSGGRGGSMHLFDRSVGILGTVPIVAATIPIAVGAGLAEKLRDTTKVSVCFFGDGSMEEGHFFESLNLASLYKLPVIFVCENNLYASHLSLDQRRSEDNLVDLVAPHGLPSSRVDGNDVVEVAQTANEAVERARTGNGPSFLECRTYRWRGHVGASWDMDVGVKRRGELDDWVKRDPIKRVHGRLVELGVAATDMIDVENAIAREVEDALEYARESPSPDPRSAELHVFAGESEG